MTNSAIPGYAFGTSAVPRSPVSLADFELMKETALFGEDDVRYLRMSHPVVERHADEIAAAWHEYTSAHPHLARAFADERTGRVDEAYAAAVRTRFRQWLLDTAAADYGRAWIDWQVEIGRRHHRTRKNRTDGARAAEIVPFRFLATTTYAFLSTLKPFLAKDGHRPADAEAMYVAWSKSLVLQVTLWCLPYVKDGDY
jgi:hypothetical protein